MTRAAKTKPSVANPATPTRRIAKINSAMFCSKIGIAGTMDSDLANVAAEYCDIMPELHAVFGPGLRLRWKQRPGWSKFIPISNVRDIQYTEKEE